MKNHLIAIAVLLVFLAACSAPGPAVMKESGSTPAENSMMHDDSMTGRDSMTKDAPMMKNDSMMAENESMMSRDSMMEEKSMMNDSMMASDSMMKQDDSTASEPVVAPTAARLIAGKSSPYYWWDSTLFEKANEEGKYVYLEFSANWCPVCQEQEPELINGFSQLTRTDVVGFKIPYKDSETTDEHTQLARKYGIAYQHTKVILHNGQIVLKSPQAWKTNQFLDEVNKLG